MPLKVQEHLNPKQGVAELPPQQQQQQLDSKGLTKCSIFWKDPSASLKTSCSLKTGKELLGLCALEQQAAYLAARNGCNAYATAVMPVQVAMRR